MTTSIVKLKIFSMAKLFAACESCGHKLFGIEPPGSKFCQTCLWAWPDGNIKSDGKYDHLLAATIKRYGPKIIINYYRLGVDPQKAVDIYHGRRSDANEAGKKEPDKQANTQSAKVIRSIASND